VVDDGSSDGTWEWLVSQGSQLRAIRQANRGPGAARNTGARSARGHYIAFLDSDDLWFPWTLDVYGYVIRDCREPSFIAGKPHVFSEQRDQSSAVAGVRSYEQFADYLASGDQWRWWGASSFVIRRDSFEAADGFTEQWGNGEDADLALRLGLAPGFAQVTAPVTFAYREHEASAMKDLKRTLAGARSKILAEKAGRYPGRDVRAMERRRILTRHTRPVTLSCLRKGLGREAWDLYVSTFAWNASLGRLKFLAAFPFLAVAQQFRHRNVARSL